MPPNAFLATLAQSLAANGSESEVYLSQITTLTGETITTSQFSTLGRGVITVDPLSSINIEFVSFTAVDATGIGFTGITRGLSALSNSTVTANKKYHAPGTQVIISFGVHNLLDLQTYIVNTVSGSLGTASDTVSGSTKTTMTPPNSLPRSRSALVSQFSSSGTTHLYVLPFSMEYNNNVYGNVPTAANPPVLSNADTGAFATPASNPRIDLVVWTTASSPGSVAIRKGTEAASPTPATPTTGDIVLCSVFNRTTQSKITERDNGTDGYILQWYEPDVYVTTSGILSSQVDAGIDATQTVENTTIVLGGTSGGSNYQQVAQSFVPTVTNIQGFRLYKVADTGTFTGTVTVGIQADSSGSPSGSYLASVTITNAVWLTIPSGNFAVSFSSEYSSMTAGSTYWCVASTSTTDNSNHPNLGYDNMSAHGLVLKGFISSAWATVATSSLTFQSLSGRVSRILQTGTDGMAPRMSMPYSLLQIDATSASASATTTETTVFTSASIDGGTFTINGGLRVRAMIATSGNSISTTANLKWNGTSLATVSTGAAGNGAGLPTAMISLVEFFVVNQGSLSSQKTVTINQTTATAVAGGDPTLGFSQGSGTALATTTSSVNLGGVGVLTITLTNSANTGGTSSTYQGSVIEKIG